MFRRNALSGFLAILFPAVNTAAAGVLAFSLAEFATPLGPRLPRSQIDKLLKDTGLDSQLKALVFGLIGKADSGVSNLSNSRVVASV
jgi:hypothetical protein